jgi:hypothetical protein
MDKIDVIIETMYDERIPMNKLGTLKPDFKMAKNDLMVMLFNEQPTTSEAAAKMMENSAVYVDMMIAAEVLKTEKVSDTEVMVLAGSKFDKFNEEVRKYIDQDAILIRTLGVSRQDFDGIVNEYTAIVKESSTLDEIMAQWIDLEMEAKGGIIRGILFQRTIMGEILQHMQARMTKSIQHQVETSKWVQGMLPIQPPK